MPLNSRRRNRFNRVATVISFQNGLLLFLRLGGDRRLLHSPRFCHWNQLRGTPYCRARGDSGVNRTTSRSYRSSYCWPKWWWYHFGCWNCRGGQNIGGLCRFTCALCIRHRITNRFSGYGCCTMLTTGNENRRRYYLAWLIGSCSGNRNRSLKTR